MKYVYTRGDGVMFTFWSMYIYILSFEIFAG